ncbi:MAG: hypothetical protein IJJ33_13655 [Victivallales bacterium]|nr:hypothetical protein [Victivallales bacterium]
MKDLRTANSAVTQEKVTTKAETALPHPATVPLAKMAECLPLPLAA